ncbi:MAG: ABC transporter substrate-binding protein [Actinomycetota bacterium]
MRRVLLIGSVFLALMGAACGRDSSPGSARSEKPAAEGSFPATIGTGGGQVRIASRPRSIVSLSATATEMLFAIEAGDQVVAVDDNSNYPPEAPKTNLSGFQPNVEAIAGFKADLVVYSNDPGDLGKSLKALGIPALLLPFAKNLDDTYRQIENLGRATGHPREAGDLVASMKAGIAEIVAARSKSDTAPTYYHELDNNFYSATSKTFIGGIYGLLGLKNIADGADRDGSGFPQLSAEYIIQADPDLIFLADTKCCGQSEQTVAARPGWTQIQAVSSGRVIALDDDVVSRWGPRIVEFLRSASKAVKELEMVKS